MIVEIITVTACLVLALAAIAIVVLSLANEIARLIYRTRIQPPPGITLPDDVSIRLCGWVPNDFHAWATTVGNTILVPISTVGDAYFPTVIKHELTHVDQWRRLGRRYLFVILEQYAKYGTHNAPMEKEARAAAGEPV